MMKDSNFHWLLTAYATTYVDDVVSGAENPEEARELISQLCALFAKGGFSLSKWASNVTEILPSSSEQVEVIPIQQPESDSIKVLGLFWSSIDDSFSYVTLPPPSSQVTKRIMLSAVARIFDPLGLLTPVVFTAKYFIQAVWKAGVDWDEELPRELSDAWKELMIDWHILSSITIPRYISNVKAITQLFGFCDASSKGYAASIYLRSESSDGDVKVSLVKAKSKVAPIKYVSIARLELCGALLLARLLSSVPQVSEQDMVCFTDSQVVLSWLHTPTHALGVFEANRVSQILDTVSIEAWRHVSSEDNPADLASRGCSPEELKDAPIWWNGPQWLSLPVTYWLKPTDKTVVHSSVTPIPKQVKAPYDWTTRFSSFSALIRTTARILRFLAQRRTRISTSSPSSAYQHPDQFSSEEIAEAEIRIIHFIQCTYLPPEFFNKTRMIPKAFASLSPFLDERGIVRVGGRLQESSIPYAGKHPILIPRQAPLAKLIVESLHSNHFHAGPALTLALLRGKYWIPTAAKLIRGRIQRCVHCRILRAQPVPPLMAPLPKARFDKVRAFSQTGVDYAGPFLLKESKRRNASLGKAYLCLFICMSSKAVHLELVSSLTTSAFLACLERFVARRGVPNTLWSDHGTNFVGASKFLKEVFRVHAAAQTTVTNTLAMKGIDWKFIPPRAPHFGGLWEAGIKSVKRLLTSSVGSQPYIFEELATTLAKIEALLNSRPLCPLTEDVSSFDFLTPGHFLIGGPLNRSTNNTDEPSSFPALICRWKLVEAHVAHVWKRWRKEYLHTLQQRHKWTEIKPSLNVGDLVILLEKRSLVGQWPVARVTSTFPGRDGITRTLTVLTPSGSYLTRAVTSVVPLFHPENDKD